jgi:hypothetical protein
MEIASVAPYAFMGFAGTALSLYAVLHFVTNKIGHVIALLIQSQFHLL